MEEESLHIRYLIVIAAVLCVLMIGYNAFFVPEAALPVVVADVSCSSSQSAASGEEYVPKSPSSGAAFTSSPSSKAGEAGKININTATAQQLSDGLDGVGAVMAKRIVEYREKNGKFRTIAELKNVAGIGDKTFAGFQNKITVGGE